MPSDAKVDLFYDSTWNDISADSLGRDGIAISHGQQDEASASDPSSCNLSIWNSTSRVNTAITGRYTPRNPLSDLYGKISRNDKIRVRVAATGKECLRLPEDATATTPDSAALDITGDIDIRVDLDPDTWRPTTNHDLISKSEATGDQRSWRFKLLSTGALQLEWYTAGTLASSISSPASTAITDDGVRRAVRVTMDVNDGAGNRVVKYYTSTSLDGTWTQLGSTSTVAGTTSIFSGSASLQIGESGGGDLAADVYGVEVRNGIDGTAVADPDFNNGDPDERTYTDSNGLVWTLNGQARIVRPDLRFCGGVASWPPRWDVSGSDSWIPVEASGILRRMGQGASSLRSSLYRDLSTKSNLVAYWPCEDGESATKIAPGVGDKELSVIGDVTMAAHSGVDGTDPLPEFGTGTLVGGVPSYGQPTDQRIFALVSIPAGGMGGTERSVLQLKSSGTVKEWKLRVVTATGGLKLYGYDSDGVAVVTSSEHGTNLNGQVAIVWLWLNIPSANTVQWQIGAVKPHEAMPVSVVQGTRASSVPGVFTSVTVGSTADMQGAALGHVGLMNSDVHGAFWDTITSSLIAWSGEEAHDRFSRLAEEEGISAVVHGSASELMGAQTSTTLLDLWQQCADTDLGLLNETGCDGWLFRTHKELENQDPAITLDYKLHLTPPLEPVDDDQALRNDVTVTRANGSSARATLDTGPLSTAAVGRYDDSVELNLHRDGQTLHQAWWRLHLGTVDEARYPSVTIGQLRTSSLRADVLSIEEGDLIRIINLPAWLPPDDVDLIVLGRNEVISVDGLHTVTFNCIPASPWTVGVVGDSDLGRADTLDSTTTASFVSGTGTSLSVATNKGPIWTTSAAEFPFHIKVAGVVLNVTNIAGASSPQTFTVDATPVNGVAKTIPSGSAVSLANPAYVGL